MTAPSSTASSSHQNPLARSHACRSDGTFRGESVESRGRRATPMRRRREGIRTLNASMASPSERRAVDRARLSGGPRLLEGGHSRFSEKVTHGEPSPRQRAGGAETSRDKYLEPSGAIHRRAGTARETSGSWANPFRSARGRSRWRASWPVRRALRTRSDGERPPVTFCYPPMRRPVHERPRDTDAPRPFPAPPRS